MPENNRPYRNSKQRQIVLNAVVHSNTHPTADWVYANIKAKHPSISLATVYRNLDVLCKQGYLGRVKVGNAPEYFDRNRAPHYHFSCTQCGALLDMPMEYNHGLDAAANQHGLAVEGHVTVFYGLCPDCQKNSTC